MVERLEAKIVVMCLVNDVPSFDIINVENVQDREQIDNTCKDFIKVDETFYLLKLLDFFTDDHNVLVFYTVLPDNSGISGAWKNISNYEGEISDIDEKCLLLAKNFLVHQNTTEQYDE